METVANEQSLCLVELKGTQGEQGIPGSGTTITVEDEGSPLPNTPHDTLNFTGDLVTASDAGGGTADIDIPHRDVRQLIHFIDSGPALGFASGAFQETLGIPFPTSVIWWESAAKLEKIVELTITRNANQTPATEEWKMYDTDGSTVLETVTDTISYSGIFESSRTRTIA